MFKFLTHNQVTQEAQQRQQHLLSILLVGSIYLTLTALIISTADYAISGPDVYDGLNPIIVLIILLMFYGLYRMSKTRYYLIGSYSFVILYFFLSHYMFLRWSLFVPQGWLLLVFAIYISGITISNNAAIVTTVIAGISIVIINHLADIGRIQFDLQWTREPLGDDLIAHIFMLGIITIVSWLANQEIQRLLKQSLKAQQELKKQRDLLEVKVEERTRALKRSQLEKMMQLYRFAEFGRMASGVFHDLSNPLTTVSLSLEGLKDQASADELARAIEGTQRMQRFIGAAKRQFQRNESIVDYSLCEEIEQAITVLAYRARKERVKIELDCDSSLSLHGNPIKFQQIMTNVIKNAIDSYEERKDGKRKRLVTITARPHEEGVCVAIQDTGCGIKRENLPKIFDPFFTTKSIERGTGIGLSITKEIVEKDYNGRIEVKSRVGHGTTFTLYLYPASNGR